MAQEMNEAKLWLPSEFLTDEELLMDFQNERNGYVNLFNFNSNLSSPVESVVGSVETESDEDDYITGLARKLAHSTLEESRFHSENSKVWELYGSPQSTLYGHRCKPRSCWGNPSPISQEAKGVTAWDLLCAAAEEAAKIRVIEETTNLCSGNLFGFSRNSIPLASVPLKSPGYGSGFYQSGLSYQQIQVNKFLRLKQQQMMKQRQQGIGVLVHEDQKIVPDARNLDSSMGWTAVQKLQRQQRSGARAVFLGESDTNRKRNGTGVFLPNRFGPNPFETRKKTGSSALVPVRVIDSRNVNLKSMDSQQPHAHLEGNEFLDADTALKHRNAILMSQQMKNFRPPPRMNQELSLPQEWTY